MSGWLAATVGVSITVSPFVLTGPVGEGTAMVSTVVAGIVAAMFAGYTGVLRPRALRRTTRFLAPT